MREYQTMGKITRRALIGGAAATTLAAGYGYHRLRARPAAAPLGFKLSEEERAHALELLEKYPAFDSHAHPGRTFARGASGLPAVLNVYKAQSGFESRTIKDMREGRMAGACFAAVSDINVMGMSQTAGLYARRPFEEGEAWESYRIQINNLKNLARRKMVSEVLSPAELTIENTTELPAAVWSVEGGDFLSGSVERLRECFEDGVRSITLVHYRNNELADTMTGSPNHGGLSHAGRSIIAEMNQLGMVIDLSHMAASGAEQALDVSTSPVMFSHTHISMSGSAHPRFISMDLARAAIDRGAIIGAWPAGIGLSTLSDYGDRIVQLIGMFGVEHVCLGTDMDANYKPVFDDYRRLPDLVGLLVRKGLNEAELSAFLSGNFKRVWGECLRSAG